MKIKIVNKRKFIMMCLILVILVSIVLMGINHTYSKTEVSYKEEFIYEGDTLWSISERELKENKYYKGNDINVESKRDTISELKNINNIDGNLKVGEKILIPIFN